MKKNDELFATGTLGGELFNDFFSKLNFKLSMEYGPGAKNLAASEVVVTELTHFRQQQVRC